MSVAREGRIKTGGPPPKEKKGEKTPASVSGALLSNTSVKKDLKTKKKKIGKERGRGKN